jgi:hypothetical protein
MIWKIVSTRMGERPMDGSSSRSRLGRAMSAADREHLLLAARERPAFWVTRSRRRGKSVNTIEVGRDRLAVPPRERPELEVLENGHAREDPSPFRRLRDAEAHDAVGRERVEALAVEAHGPAPGSHRSQDRPQRRGLAGAVGADEGDDLADRTAA